MAAGQGASAKTALYFADGDQMHDFRTTQRHEAPKTTSDLLFKVRSTRPQRLHRADQDHRRHPRPEPRRTRRIAT
ncbi:MAG: hypothetical protein R2705_09890 [Ilumatobacteraceae bacterium]